MAETLVTLIVGVFILILAFLVGVKKKVKIIRKYQYKRVTEENMPVFCSLFGLGMGILAIGMIVFGILFSVATETAAVITWIIFMIIGLIVLLYAEIRYNHGII